MTAQRIPFNTVYTQGVGLGLQDKVRRASKVQQGTSIFSSGSITSFSGAGRGDGRNCRSPSQGVPQNPVRTECVWVDPVGITFFQ